MQLEVRPDELDVLDEVLSSGLGDLKEQIYKTEVAEYKQVLKERERIVVQLLERVRALKVRQIAT